MTSLNQKQHKVFYGWWIVGASSFISAYIFGVTYYSFTAIFEPIADEFGWSYTLISFAASMRGLQLGILAPLVGFLIDRWGARKPVFIGIVIAGLGLLLLSRINSLWAFYGTFILISVGTSTCGAVVVMTLIGNWFRRNVSIATGIALGGSSVGGLLVILVTRLVDMFEWRAAMIILGLGAWVILLPLSLLLRHKPEQYGYLPDGDISQEPVSNEGLPLVESTELNIGVKQALKSRAFWHISIGFACHVLATSAVTTHVMPYLSTVGVVRSTSSLVASAIAVGITFGRLSFGWLGDRYDKQRVTSLGFAISGVGILLFSFVAAERLWLLVPFVIFFSIGLGGPLPMIGALLRKYFGRVRLGTILGLAVGVAMLGNITGSPLAGWIFDTFGSYQGAWISFAGLIILGIFSILTIPSAGSTILISGSQEENKNT